MEGLIVIDVSALSVPVVVGGYVLGVTILGMGCGGDRFYLFFYE